MNFEPLLVSASPSIYARPGSLGEFHDRLITRDRSSAAGIEHLFQLYPPAYYRRPATNDIIVETSNFTNFLIEHYNSEKHCHVAASAVVNISDAVICDNIIYCHGQSESFILYETYRANDRAAVSLSEGALSQDLPLAPFYESEHDYLFIGSAGSFNYGHWLVDDLPRAKAWLELKERGLTPKILIPDYDSRINQIKSESLHLLVDDRISVIFIDPKTPYRVPNLYFATPVTHHPRVKSPAAIDFLRFSANRIGKQNYTNAFRRIFIARNSGNTRRMTNYEEVVSFMRARHFEIIEVNNLSFSDQLSLFRDADFVVGQMGAAMTSSIFSRNGTNLIYLAPHGWTEPFYHDLATVSGHQYHALYGPAVDPGEPALANFTLPLGELHHRLMYMGIDPS